MINQSIIEKLKRISKGLSNPEEENYIYSLFAEKAEDSEFMQLIHDEFDEYLEAYPDENHNISYLLDRIHHSIHKNENKKKDSVLKRIYRLYSLAAAVLLIPILIGGGIWYIFQNQEKPILEESPVTSTLFAPLGSRISFSLPDGTNGWLNSGSSLEYSLPFNKNRQVTVLGEAWFDVAHDANHPFEIAAGNSKVKVMGTKFNLDAYPEDDHIEVALEEGKVEFFAMGQSNGVVMNPNERLVFSDGAVNINVTDATKYTVWKEGKLVFRDDPMAEVARRIERWYNVDVELDDKELEGYIFRGTFQDDALEEVLRYLSMTSPINYRIVERKLQDDGTIQIRKVILNKKKI